MEISATVNVGCYITDGGEVAGVMVMMSLTILSTVRSDKYYAIITLLYKTATVTRCSIKE